MVSTLSPPAITLSVSPCLSEHSVTVAMPSLIRCSLSSLSCCLYLLVKSSHRSSFPRKITSSLPSPLWGAGRVRDTQNTVVIFEPFLKFEFSRF